MLPLTVPNASYGYQLQVTMRRTLQVSVMKMLFWPRWHCAYAARNGEGARFGAAGSASLFALDARGWRAVVTVVLWWARVGLRRNVVACGV